jgi:hypothetical protein
MPTIAFFVAGHLRQGCMHPTHHPSSRVLESRISRHTPLQEKRTMNAFTPAPLLALSLMSVAFAACKKPADEPAVISASADTTSLSISADSARAKDVSMVRFVNAIESAKTLNLMADSVAIFTAVEYGKVSPYATIARNIVRFSVRGDSGATPTTVNNEVMRDGGRYTIVAHSERNGTIGLRIFRDDLTPAAGQARVRLIHAAPGVDDVDVMRSGQKDVLFSDIDFGSEAGFKDVAPGTIGFTIRTDDRGAALATIAPQAISAGSAYTMVLTARPNGKLTTIGFVDTPVR